jgi:hypothetical protein
VIYFLQTCVGGDVRVATVDAGLKAKLHSRQIKVLWLPDDLRLPEEPDEATKEIEALRRENARLLLRKPELALQFEDGSTHQKIALYNLELPELDPLSEIRTRHPKMPEPHTSASLSMFAPTAKQVQEYNDRIEAFYSAWERHRTAMDEWRKCVQLYFTVSLRLTNIGSAKATDIYADLILPSHVIACEGDELPPRPPSAPNPPPKFSPFPWLTGWGMPYGLNPTAFSRGTSLVDALASGERPRLIIREGMQSLTFRVPDLTHHRSMRLPDAIFRFKDHASIKSFAVNYTITSAETLDPTSGDLSFILPRE